MAVAAYGAWGLLPIYWKALDGVPAVEILCHRIVWSLGFIVAVLLWRRRRGGVLAYEGGWRTHGWMTLSTALIATNWGLFIWSVSVDRVAEASLGYYINPLINVALARVFLGERLRPMQAVAVLLALSGVVYLTVAKGSLPWVSLVLALTFSLYGLIRKRTPVGAAEGLAVETGLVAPLALGYLALLEPSFGALRTETAPRVVLLLASGVVTALPLLAFAGAARRLRYTTLGMVQYLAPTLQLACAVLLYGEPFGPVEAVTFGLIWIAVAIYLVDLMRLRRENRRAAAGQRPLPTAAR